MESHSKVVVIGKDISNKDSILRASFYGKSKIIAEKLIKEILS